MVDVDGKPTYSNIISLDLSLVQGVTIYPNPSNGLLQVEGKDIQQVIIYNEAGVMVFAQDIFHERTTLSLTNQPKGNYIVKLIKTDGNVFSSKMVLK